MRCSGNTPPHGGDEVACNTCNLIGWEASNNPAPGKPNSEQAEVEVFVTVPISTADD